MEGEIERRSVTYSEWKDFQKGTMDRRGWHPITFDYSKATLGAIIDIQVLKKTLRNLSSLYVMWATKFW